ncbi:uncharacterized protein LOC110910996 isoform X1 [Helianthus annuus]|uniref:uncharacterized protein LOC110910996 isoform X1 n=1 Tax=Helianthus annuus TaxID=4232 RepID=UPI001652CA3A|nr:uncharacterized protein LOC110910996 isoform X1 [Helianthus annuus]
MADRKSGAPATCNPVRRQPSSPLLFLLPARRRTLAPLLLRRQFSRQHTSPIPSFVSLSNGWSTTIVDGGGGPTRILTAAMSATAVAAACDCAPTGFSERVPATTQQVSSFPFQFSFGWVCVVSVRFSRLSFGFGATGLLSVRSRVVIVWVTRNKWFGFVSGSLNTSQQQSTRSTKVNRSTLVNTGYSRDLVVTSVFRPPKLAHSSTLG